MHKLIFFALFAYITSAYATEDDQHTRILAASCAACHGTNGLSQGGTPILAGLDESYFIKRMTEYRMQSNSTDVMVQHANGLTLEEITNLGKYFAKQPRACPYFQKRSLRKQLKTMQEN